MTTIALAVWRVRCPCGTTYLGTPTETPCPDCSAVRTWADTADHARFAYYVNVPEGATLCLKRVVVATLVTPSGRLFRATNYRQVGVRPCPRAGLPTGQGYDLCRTVCQQPAHAEINVLELAGKSTREHGSFLIIDGHSYACDSCVQAAKNAGVWGMQIGDEIIPF